MSQDDPRRDPLQDMITAAERYRNATGSMSSERRSATVGAPGSDSQLCRSAASLDPEFAELYDLLGSVRLNHGITHDALGARWKTTPRPWKTAGLPFTEWIAKARFTCTAEWRDKIWYQLDTKKLAAESRPQDAPGEMASSTSTAGAADIKPKEELDECLDLTSKAGPSSPPWCLASADAPVNGVAPPEGPGNAAANSTSESEGSPQPVRACKEEPAATPHLEFPKTFSMDALNGWGTSSVPNDQGDIMNFHLKNGMVNSHWPLTIHGAEIIITMADNDVAHTGTINDAGDTITWPTWSHAVWSRQCDEDGAAKHPPASPTLGSADAPVLKSTGEHGDVIERLRVRLKDLNEGRFVFARRRMPPGCELDGWWFSRRAQVFMRIKSSMANSAQLWESWLVGDTWHCRLHGSRKTWEGQAAADTSLITWGDKDRWDRLTAGRI